MIQGSSSTQLSSDPSQNLQARVEVYVDFLSIISLAAGLHTIEVATRKHVADATVAATGKSKVVAGPGLKVRVCC